LDFFSYSVSKKCLEEFEGGTHVHFQDLFARVKAAEEISGLAAYSHVPTSTLQLCECSGTGGV